MSVLQRFPPELIYTIVLGVLGEQLTSIVHDTPEQQKDVDDAKPSLALLHLCHGFRVCTVKVLRHMWSGKRDGGRCVYPGPPDSNIAVSCADHDHT